MNESLLTDLKEARDYLFELYDDQEHEEIKVALRLVNREIRRVESDDRKQQSAVNNGKAWAKWSERYGRTRNSGQSLLQSEGDLLDSIQYLVNGEEVQKEKLGWPASWLELVTVPCNVLEFLCSD